jgi:hypothetical protein
MTPPSQDEAVENVRGKDESERIGNASPHANKEQGVAADALDIAALVASQLERIRTDDPQGVEALLQVIRYARERLSMQESYVRPNTRGNEARDDKPFNPYPAFVVEPSESSPEFDMRDVAVRPTQLNNENREANIQGMYRAGGMAPPSGGSASEAAKLVDGASSVSRPVQRSRQEGQRATEDRVQQIIPSSEQVERENREATIRGLRNSGGMTHTIGSSSNQQSDAARPTGRAPTASDRSLELQQKDQRIAELEEELRLGQEAKPRSFEGWTIRKAHEYYRLYKSIGGRVYSIHVGRELDEDKMRAKIAKKMEQIKAGR